MELDLDIQEPSININGDLPEYDTAVDSTKPKADKAANEGAFYNTALTGSVDIVNDFSETRDNLLNTGTDPSTENTKVEIAETNKQIIQEQAVDVIADSNIPMQQKKDVLYRANEAIEEPVDIRKEYMLKEAAGYTTDDPNNKVVQENLIEGIDEIYQADSDIRKMLQNDFYPYLNDSNAAKTFHDFLGTAVPFNIAQTYRNIIERVFGEDESKFAYLVAPGEGLRFIKDRLWHTVDPQERKDLAKELIEAINETAGTFDNNDYIKWQVSLEIFKHQLDTGTSISDTDWDRIIHNIVGPLDVLAVGQVFGKVLRVGRGAELPKNSPIEVTSHVNPEKTKQLIATAVADESGKIAKILSTTREDLIESTMYPKPLDIASHQKMPADVAEVVTDVQQKANDIITRTESFGFAFTDAEKAATVDRTIAHLEKTAGAKYYQNISEVTADSEALTVRARFGYDENHGFSNGLEASRKGAELFPGSEIKILKRNSKGDIVPTTKLSGKGEYFFEINETRVFSKGDELFFEPNSVNHAGLFWIGPTSPSAKFSAEISNIGSILPGIEKKVQTDLLSVLKSFTALGTKSKNLVSNVILKGYKEGKAFSYDDLVSMNLNNNEIKGYYSLRGLEDLKYVIENRRVYKDLKQQGMLHITHQKNKFTTIAKPITEAEAATKAGTAFDTTTGAIRTLTPDDIAQLYKNGDSIGFLYGTERAGENITNFVILDSKAGVRSSPLPAKVLNYDPGYITRVYKNRYFIDEASTRIVNGKRIPYTRTVHTAGTEIEALAHIAKLREAGEEGVKYVARLDRGLTQAQIASREKDMRINKGALFTGTRGKQLTTDLGLAEIEDPVEALLRTVGTVSRHASRTDVIASMKQRWMNTYGAKFGNTFPAGAGSKEQFTLARNADVETVGMIDDAEAYWKYINTLEDVDPTGKIVDVRANMVKFGEWILGKGDNRIREIVGNKVLDASAIDPMGRIRSLAFTAYLAVNPQRQIIIQSAQYMFLAGLDPKFSTFVFSKSGLVRQKLGLDLAMATFTNPEAWKRMRPIAAKAVGISEKEIEVLVKSFRESGLPFSIDSHTFVRDSLQDYSKIMHKNNLTKYASNVFTFPKKVIGAARKVGFDWGEYNNLSTTWLFARNKWIRNNPGKNIMDRSAQDLIAAESRQYSLTMTKEGAFNYQRGVLSIITQFLSIQHKALEAAIPIKMGGSRFFSAAEKRRLALGQAVIYGPATGLGLGKLYKEVRDRMDIDVPEDVNKIMLGGLSEYVFNKGLQTIYANDTEIRFSKHLAPISGILETNIQKMIHDVIVGGESPLTLTPAGTVVNRAYKALEYGAQMMQAPHIETTEALLETLDSGIAVFSGYNNYLKSAAAMNLGHMVNNTGDPLVEATYQEAMGKLFGFQSGREADYYDVLIKSYKDVSGKRQGDKFKDIAKTYYENLSKRVAFFSGSVDSLDELNHSRLVEAIQTEAQILAVLSPMDRYAVLAEFRKIVQRNTEVGSDRLISSLTKNAIGNQYGDSWSVILNRLKNSELMDSPEKIEDLKKLYDFMTDEQAFMENQ